MNDNIERNKSRKTETIAHMQHNSHWIPAFAGMTVQGAA
jgi:hypothetical protein